EGVVGHLARPRQVPQGTVELLDRQLEIADQIEPEAGSLLEQVSNRVVGLARGSLDLGAGGWRAGQTHILAEVQRHLAAAAAQRPGADPNHLATGAELVEPRRAIRPHPPRQHVALPDVGRQSDALKRDDRLAEAVRPGAGWAVGVDVLPAG